MIPIKTNKIFKKRILNQNNTSKELSVNKIHRANIFSKKKTTIRHTHEHTHTHTRHTHKHTHIYIYIYISYLIKNGGVVIRNFNVSTKRNLETRCIWKD